MIRMQAALTLPILLLALAPSAVEAQKKNQTVRPSVGRRVAGVARRAVTRPIRLQRRDCSGFVEAVLRRAGTPQRGNTKSFYLDAVREKRVRRRPRLGDLVFFDRTYDRNRNGRTDDVLTHIAIVTAIHRDGTVVMAHRGSSGIRSLRMNLRKPALHKGPNGKIYNDFLAEKGFGHRRLAGQLFRAYARAPRR
jgi:hypothetical protein